MTTNSTQVDYEGLIRQARIERSLAIGSALVSVVAAASRGTEWLIAKLSSAKVARGSNRPAHAADSRA